jgi:hypothetical protein
MSDRTTIPTSAAAGEVTLAVDTERAQAILHDIAVELRFVGVRGGTAHLHVRALALKRDVARWAETATVESQRQAIIDELLGLHEEAKRVRARRR